MMDVNKTTNLSSFFVAGIDYKHADTETRGRFSINEEQYASLLKLAPLFNVDQLFVLSTCNRTEIYGIADDANTLSKLLCTQTKGSKNDLNLLGYQKTGTDALDHLFEVACGLQSQILGDYEIIGQLKQAVQFARNKGFIKAFTERAINSALQASKAVKSTTSLSSGTVSVAFTAVQYIKQHIAEIGNKKILILGTGKIGRSTCKNLIDQVKTQNITLINRSIEKASDLATALNINYAAIDELPVRIEASDIIIVATNAQTPTVLNTHLAGKGTKLVIDLSIPHNVETTSGRLSNITLVNVDQLSRIKDQTLKQREKDIPKAKEIIAVHINAFTDWIATRKNLCALNTIKIQLKEFYQWQRNISSGANIACTAFDIDNYIQSIINTTASKMRTNNTAGCYHIEAINEFMGSLPDH